LAWSLKNRSWASRLVVRALAENRLELSVRRTWGRLDRSRLAGSVALDGKPAGSATWLARYAGHTNRFFRIDGSFSGLVGFAFRGRLPGDWSFLPHISNLGLVRSSLRG